ncbi:hypothetical protein D9M71_648670 [compost metagenome]
MARGGNVVLSHVELSTAAEVANSVRVLARSISRAQERLNLLLLDTGVPHGELNVVLSHTSDVLTVPTHTSRALFHVPQHLVPQLLSGGHLHALLREHAEELRTVHSSDVIPGYVQILTQELAHLVTGVTAWQVVRGVFH